jgi:hypothetical protein
MLLRPSYNVMKFVADPVETRVRALLASRSRGASFSRNIQRARCDQYCPNFCGVINACNVPGWVCLV